MTKSPTVLVTGAGGLVGRAVVNRLVQEGMYHVRAAVRGSSPPFPEGVEVLKVDDLSVLSAAPDKAMQGVHAIVHCAALTALDPSRKITANELWRVNHHETLALAHKAANAGVQHFVLLSSIKVNGERTAEGRPFDESSPFAPEGDYAESKAAAERELLKVARDTSLQVTIIRAPLVYGERAAGNFRTLVRLLQSGIPLPFGSVRENRRSLVYVGNLADLVARCVAHPNAANRVLVVADDEAVSTCELLQNMAEALGLKAKLIPVSPALIAFGASAIGREEIARRLLDSLEASNAETKRLLNWEPPFSLKEGLHRALAGQQVQARRALSAQTIRLADIVLSLMGLVFASPLMLTLLICGWLDTGSPLFRQVRVGRHQKPFSLWKFRTMRTDTASVATHLADANAVTSFGRFLRRTKLDELPQLWNVLKGEMSLVGPRPCLFNQHELIEERAKRGVFDTRPGITGLAQVNAIDMSTPELLAETDARMLRSLNMAAYFRYIAQTVSGKGAGDRIRS